MGPNKDTTLLSDQGGAEAAVPWHRGLFQEEQVPASSQSSGEEHRRGYPDTLG